MFSDQAGGGGAGSPYGGSLSMADKLRVAASKGQEDKVHELLKGGATFEPDRVSRKIMSIKSKAVAFFEFGWVSVKVPQK